MKLKGKMMQRWPPKVDLSFCATLVNHSVCKLYCAKLSGAKHYCTKLYCAKNLSVYNSVRQNYTVQNSMVQNSTVQNPLFVQFKTILCTAVQKNVQKYFMVY